MYSDNINFSDNVFDADIDLGNFDANELMSDGLYPNLDPILQTLPRHFATSDSLQLLQFDENTNNAAVHLLSSPQPMTVRKLKTQLSGVGGEGGYLTSPMGLSRKVNNSNYNMINQTTSTSTSDFNVSSAASPAKSATLPSVPQFQTDENIRVPTPRSHSMQRLRSAPPVFNAPSPSPLPTYQMPEPAPVLMQRAQTVAPPTTKHVTSNPGLGLPSASFENLDYGAMRIYGRPIQKSHQGDPHAPVASTSSYLPYPEHLPTITLGRGVKNARDINHQEAHSQYREPSPSSSAVPHQPNLDKPFIQYVPPNSPAAKQAGRNKRQLTIKTDANGNAKPSTKLVAVKMTSPRQMPLSPPLTTQAQAFSPTSYPVPQISPSKIDYGYSMPPGYHSGMMPSFEFSLEEYGNNTVQDAHQQQQQEGQYQQAGSPQLAGATDNHFDLQALLGLPTPGIESCSSASSAGMLSPPLHSACSSSSSVFSTDPEGNFGISPSSFFETSASIDQTLASLLEGHQLTTQNVNSLSPQPNQANHQALLGVGSPPLSPHQRQNTAPVSLQWSPYGQQVGSPGQYASTFLDPALQALDNGNGLLSPTSNRMTQGFNGRPISSPRRLRGMQSAPNLGQMYAHEQQENMRSPSTRKASLKRQRSFYDEEDDDDAYGQRNENTLSDFSGDDDEYEPDHITGFPPAKRRASSTFATLEEQYNIAPSQPSFPSINPNPSRLRPGPKPKTSLPNLQAARQTVFSVAHNAPPVPPLPLNFATASNLQLPQQALSPLGSPLLSPEMMSPGLDGGFGMAPGCSKDMLAQFYCVGSGSRQTKKGKPQRMYICTIPGCGKEFPRKSAVESHIQTHLEDKPFSCPYDNCGASFVRSHDLTRHVRIHSGSKPFECQCGKGFARGDALTRHKQRGICEGSVVPRRW